MGKAVTRGDPLVRVTLAEDGGLKPLPVVGEARLTLPPRVSSRVRRELRPPPPFPKHWRRREGQQGQEAEAQPLVHARMPNLSLA